MTRIYAAADIGSNTAHLLVAASDGRLVMRVDNYNEWIPLGEVVTKRGEVPKEQAQQLVMSVKEFRRLAREKQAERLYIFATEGMRLARNHNKVIEKIRSETGIDVEIIPPAREAELSLRGVLLDTRHMNPDLLIEVGGGSVQIAQLDNGRIIDEESLPMGTGRVIAETGLTSPCPDLAYRAAENYIAEVLSRSKIVPKASVAVASGGVGRGLWRALHPDGQKVLALEEVDYIAWSTRRLAVDRISTRFGVKAKRAETLLPGALIYRALMHRFELGEILISEFGIREGAILEMAVGGVRGCDV